MTSDDIKKSVPTLERHLQTIVAVCIVGLLAWVGNTVQETQVAIAVLTVEIEQLKMEVKRPDSKFLVIEQRLDSIERKLGIHMEDVLNHSKDEQ